MTWISHRLVMIGTLWVLAALMLGGCGNGEKVEDEPATKSPSEDKPKEAKLPEKKVLPKETLPSQQNPPSTQPTTPKPKPGLPEWPVLHKITFPQPVKDLVLSQDGSVLVASGGNQVQAFSTKTWESIKVISQKLNSANAVSISPDGSQLAVLQTVFGPDGKVAWWNDWRSGEPIFFEAHPGVTFCLSFGPASNPLLATGGNDRYIKLWQTKTQTAISTLRGHEDLVGQLAFSPDGRRLASGSADGKVLLWNLTGSAEPREGKQHRKDVTALAFANRSDQFASGGDDSAIYLWQTDSLREARILFGHEAVVTGLAYSPNDKFLVSSSGDLSVRAWNLAAKRDHVVMREHTDYVNCVVLSADGKYAISGGDDQTICVWEVPAAWQALDTK